MDQDSSCYSCCLLDCSVLYVAVPLHVGIIGSARRSTITLSVVLVRLCELAMSCALSNVLRKWHAALALRDEMDAITDPTAEQKASRARHVKYIDDELYHELIWTTHVAQGPDDPAAEVRAEVKKDMNAAKAMKAKEMLASTAMKANKAMKKPAKASEMPAQVMKKPAKLLKVEKAVKEMLLDMSGMSVI